jgi:pyrroloquinoline-quinone synthase
VRKHFFMGSTSVIYVQDSFVLRVDQEIERQSLLKHPFYQLWSKGDLSINHLQGYSKEYFQLVKLIPRFVGNIISNSFVSGLPYFANESFTKLLNNSMQEESDHITPWVDFATSIGVPKNELLDYQGSDKTNKATEEMRNLTEESVTQGAAAMYAYEKELPKISNTKLEGLQNFYGLTDKKCLNYFEIHQEIDIKHAAIWREALESIDSNADQEAAFAASKSSLTCLNTILDDVHEKYVGMIPNC